MSYRYLAEPHRYETMTYRSCGRSGLKLPLLSLGLWHNFGDATPLDQQRALLRTAFDLGITHFDLANNYGPPFGSAEVNFGRLFRDDFQPYRDELVISTKAGWDMWPGPYGAGGGSRFSALAQGLLTDKYLNGIPKDARINRPGGGTLHADHLSDENLARVRALNEIAKSRGQTLAQMAVAWVLRDPRVTTALIGASRPEQLRDNVAALKNLKFSPAELASIDKHAQEGHLNLWEKPSTDQRV